MHKQFLCICIHVCTCRDVYNESQLLAINLNHFAHSYALHLKFSYTLKYTTSQYCAMVYEWYS